MVKTDVCVVGAGPAGSIAALFLSRMGIPCILADKAVFPRDKVCGDGVSGWVLGVLGELDPDLLLRLNRQDFLLHSGGIRIVAPNGGTLDLPFLDSNPVSPEIPAGYVCKRYDLDNFLVSETRAEERITLMEGTEITGFTLSEGYATLDTGAGEKIRSRLVIFANGARSAFMRDPGGIHKDPRGTMTGIKAYYSGVTGCHPGNYVELHFLKGLLPGYFWIFPLPGGEANVGVGLGQRDIGRRKLNLRQVMLEAIDHHPALTNRFKNSRRLTGIQAYGLPLWEGKRRISGERFMLAGDAASLIDPVTGEGMGHAALSGMFAARQAERALKAGDFSGTSMRRYDRELYAKIGRELNISRNILKFIRHDWLFNGMVNRAVTSKTLQDKLALAMTDLDARQKLKNPLLYARILLGL